MLRAAAVRARLVGLRSGTFLTPFSVAIARHDGHEFRKHGFSCRLRFQSFTPLLFGIGFALLRRFYLGLELCNKIVRVVGAALLCLSQRVGAASRSGTERRLFPRSRSVEQTAVTG